MSATQQRSECADAVATAREPGRTRLYRLSVEVQRGAEAIALPVAAGADADARDNSGPSRSRSNSSTRTHECGPESFSQARFKAHDFVRSLPSVWRQRRAYVQQEALALVMLGTLSVAFRRSRILASSRSELAAFRTKYRVRYQQHLAVKDAELGGYGGLLKHGWKAVDQSKLVIPPHQ